MLKRDRFRNSRPASEMVGISNTVAKGYEALAIIDSAMETKVAIITAAGKGVGAAIASGLGRSDVAAAEGQRSFLGT